MTTATPEKPEPPVFYLRCGGCSYTGTYDQLEYHAASLGAPDHFLEWPDPGDDDDAA
jgi:hypothetical protein